MRILYDIFFLIFSLLYLPYLLVKGKFHAGFTQKFGFLPDNVIDLKNPVWVHAVSVGEAVLAAKMSAEIKRRFPDIPVIVSTTTQTGNDMIKKSGKNVVDAVFYYPLDLSAVVSRVLRLIQPRLYVMIETELWPNLLEGLYAKNIPVVLANGRISDASFSNYKKIKFITRRIFRCIDLFCMQSGKDAERVKKLGASERKLFVTGNMKFDESTGLAGSAGFSKEYLGFKEDDEIMAAGSTHYPEEQMIIDVYRELRQDRQNLKLVLAPRHVERIDAVKSHIEKYGMKYNLFSSMLSGKDIDTEGKDILLVDTIGHLKNIYGAATVIFIGGSLTRKGGQNPIEGARWAKPVIFGPHMFNFREVTEIFLENEAAVSVKDPVQLKNVIWELLRDPDRRQRIAANAGKVIETNSGTIARTVDQIEGYLGSEKLKANSEKPKLKE